MASGHDGPEWDDEDRSLERSEEEIRQFEMESMQREQSSFLSKALPINVQNCSSQLDTAICNLRAPFAALASGTGEFLSSERTIFDEQKQLGLRGHFDIKDHCVTAAAVELVSKKLNRGNPLQVSLGSSGAYLLPQIQSASNYCEIALEALDELGGGAMPSLCQISRVLDSVGELVQQARDELMLPSKSAFPRCVHLRNVFTPPLPKEVILEFSICEEQLIVSLFVVTLSSKSTASGKVENIAWVRKGSAVGQTMQYQGNWVEVQDHIEHTYRMKELEVAAEAIKGVLDICNVLKDTLNQLKTY